MNSYKITLLTCNEPIMFIFLILSSWYLQKINESNCTFVDCHATQLSVIYLKLQQQSVFDKSQYVTAFFKICFSEKNKA